MNAKSIINSLLEDYDPDLAEISPEEVAHKATSDYVFTYVDKSADVQWVRKAVLELAEATERATEGILVGENEVHEDHVDDDGKISSVLVKFYTRIGPYNKCFDGYYLYRDIDVAKEWMLEEGADYFDEELVYHLEDGVIASEA